MQALKIKNAILTVLFVSSFLGYAQNVKIKGKAHTSHIGKAISLLAYSDLITYTQTREAIDTDVYKRQVHYRRR